MKNRVQNNNGFTLIELLLVIAIIGTLSGIGVMASRDMYSSYQIRGLARQVYSDMQYARLLAIKQGKETLIDFGTDASGDVYYKPKWKADGSKLDRLDVTVYLTGENSSYRNIRACHPTDPASDPIDIEFNPNGTATSDVIDGGIKLSMDGRVYRIYVSSEGTGNVRILNKVALLDQFPSDADECP